MTQDELKATTKIQQAPEVKKPAGNLLNSSFTQLPKMGLCTK